MVLLSKPIVDGGGILFLLCAESSVMVAPFKLLIVSKLPVTALLNFFSAFLIRSTVSQV
jgi:hypothetical protein